MEHQLIDLADRYGAFTLGSDVDGWRLDRCWKPRGDRQDQWHCSLLGTSCIQGRIAYEQYNVQYSKVIGM